MSVSKHVVFLTGTRADYGKIKPLILAAYAEGFKVSVFATGMHMLARFGSTILEVQRTLPDGVSIISFENQVVGDPMDVVVANTIKGLSLFIQENQPDLLIVHGDRPEALAGAISGALSNTRVAHIEGGELSGTIDGVIRHAVSKLSHIHLVANEEAKKRLLQLGEDNNSIHIIGSPDLDIMLSPALPTLAEAKSRYEIEFDSYFIAIFHPVTTDLVASAIAATEFVNGLIDSGENFIVIHPNNDTGFEQIIDEYKRLSEHSQRFRQFESLRFEHFLVLLKNARGIVGNSSAGIREAPLYGIPSIDVGDRQRGRHDSASISQVLAQAKEIVAAIQRAKHQGRTNSDQEFGDGKSTERFTELLRSGVLFEARVDKVFVDLKDVM
ncbi:MAG: UDP-N-acetylglucosamine 2-epimerase [Actinomycetes bacterium]